jgi:hypothetical protein
MNYITLKKGTVYQIEWMPTEYLYFDTGELLRFDEKTIVIKSERDETDEVHIQRKYILSIINV